MEEKKNEDVFESFATTDDLCQLCDQLAKKIVQYNPVEVVINLRKANLITDEEYKEMITNIRTVELKGDFE